MHKLRARLPVRHETRLFGVIEGFRRIRETYRHFFTVNHPLVITPLEKRSVLCIGRRQLVPLLTLSALHARLGSWHACAVDILCIALSVSGKASRRVVKSSLCTVVCDRDRRLELLISSKSLALVKLLLNAVVAVAVAVGVKRAFERLYECVLVTDLLSELLRVGDQVRRPWLNKFSLCRRLDDSRRDVVAMCRQKITRIALRKFSCDCPLSIAPHLHCLVASGSYQMGWR